MKILVDVNLTPAWVGTLQKEGIDAVHWSEVGPLNATDLQILDYAAKKQVYSFYSRSGLW